VSTRDREGLAARIRQIRGRADTGDGPRRRDSPNPESARVDALEERMAHLERLVEGLQDSVHRESERQSKLIAELQAQIQPGAMGAALSRDARDRRLD
jgi:hypothetical protein